ncbi:hypothetical protein EIP86_003291 [Pleurotus ostreatoroseus]|nr:hypothetical protein EIP86_003291 [Pleurotus ostreatoroseus]
MCSILACERVRDLLSRLPSAQVHVHWCPSHCNIVPNEFVDEQAKAALELDPPDTVTLSAARSRIVDRMLSRWRKDAEHPRYRGHHFMVPNRYLEQLSHTARGNPFLRAAGKDSRLFARLTRFLTGHAPVGEFRLRFNLEGPVDCLCGHGLESIHHIVWQCPLWIRTWPPSSRLLEQLERLDPFADILPFLRTNRLVATFEYADFQERAQEELETSGRGGYYCGLLHQLRARAHAWYSAPFEQREQALAAFDAAQDDGL